MKIDIEKNIVKLIPGNDQETQDVEKLWRLLVGCVTDSKKLSPVGEYLPEKENAASFYIEDLPGKTQDGLEVDDNIVLEDGRYYCDVCNKLIDLHTGDEIPMCCGKRMEEID